MDKEILNLPQHIVEESTLADKISWLIETNVIHKKLNVEHPISFKIKEYLNKSSLANMIKNQFFSKGNYFITVCGFDSYQNIANGFSNEIRVTTRTTLLIMDSNINGVFDSLTVHLHIIVIINMLFNGDVVFCLILPIPQLS